MSFFGGGRSDGTELPVHAHDLASTGGDTLAPFELDMTALTVNPQGLRLTQGAFEINAFAPSISANQNDWNPSGVAATGWATALVNVSGARNLTGMDSSWGIVDAGGALVFIGNIGTGTLTCKNANTSSLAANRFAIGSDLALGPQQGAIFLYDNNALRWRLVAAFTGSAALPDHLHTAAGDGGSTIDPTNVIINGQLVQGGIVDLGVVTTSQDNIALGNASIVKLSPSGAARNLTGIVSAGAGQRCTIINYSTSQLVNIRNEGAASTAANRILTPGAVDPWTLAIGAAIDLTYDATAQRWRVLAKA